MQFIVSMGINPAQFPSRMRSVRNCALVKGFNGTSGNFDGRDFVRLIHLEIFEGRPMSLSV